MNIPERNLFNTAPANTYQNLLQIYTGSGISLVTQSIVTDGNGNQISFVNITASYALNATASAGGTLITGSTVPITSSVALVSLTAISASWASSSLSSSVAITALTASFAPNYVKKAGDTMSGQLNMSAPINMGSGQNIEFNTGATQIWDTSGYTVSAPATGLQQFQGPSGSVFFSGSTQANGGIVSASLFIGGLTGSHFGTSSWAINVVNGGGSSLITGSTVPITSSVSLVSISSSYATFAQTFPAVLPTGSTQNITASWANNVISSSYATFAQTLPAVLVTGSTYQVTSSWAVTASFAKNFPLLTGSTVPITASWAINTLTSSNSPYIYAASNIYNIPIVTASMFSSSVTIPSTGMYRYNLVLFNTTASSPAGGVVHTINYTNELGATSSVQSLDVTLLGGFDWVRPLSAVSGTFFTITESFNTISSAMTLYVKNTLEKLI
jgi:hypothetical protein